jgi:signal peptidase I
MDQAPSQSPSLVDLPRDVIATWRPRPLIAAVLNLGGAGVGHVYAGQVVGAIALSVGLVVWNLGLLYATCLFEARAMHLGLIAIPLASQAIGAPLLGYLAARRATASPKRWYQRWYALALYWLGLGIFVNLVVASVVPRLLAAYRMPSVAMVPTLLPGDHVLAISDPAGVLRRGDVVVFRAQAGPLRIQRVMGLPGDTVELRDFHAIVNGRPEEPRRGACQVADAPATWSDKTRSAANWGPAIVPAGQYVLFGDCRDQSADTRYQGFALRDQIVKHVAWIYWASDAHGVRVERIGLAVK